MSFLALFIKRMKYQMLYVETYLDNLFIKNYSTFPVCVILNNYR